MTADVDLSEGEINFTECRLGKVAEYYVPLLQRGLKEAGSKLLDSMDFGNITDQAEPEHIAFLGPELRHK